jgi:hypothetical protein
VFRGSAVVRSGRLTRAQLRSSAWRRLFPDVYACSSIRVDHRLRARAAVGLLVPEAVLSGRSAAVLWGVDLAGVDDDVECTVSGSCRAGGVRGLRVTRRALIAADITRRRGARVTTPVRTALDLARIEPVEEAVICLDRFIRSGLVTLDEVRSSAATATGPGCRRVRKAIELADGLAESPQETRLRLILHAAPLARPTAQYSVYDGSGFVARVDFAWPDLRLAVEYDGVWHGEHQQVGKDRRRLNRLSAAGWRVLFVTAADLREPAQLIARVRVALTAPRYV